MASFDGFYGHHGWQWMFLLEALPTLPLFIAVLLILDNKVEDARWLTQEERNLIRSDLDRDNAKRDSVPLAAVFRDWRVWRIIMITFAAMMGLYSLGFYLPTLVREAGVADTAAVGYYSAIPYLVAIVAMVGVGWSSDRLRERRLHLAGVLVVGATGLIASTFAGNNLAFALISLSVAAAGIISFSPIMWTLPTAFLGGATAAAAIGLINSLANLGGFVSPYLIGWIRETTHSTSPALYVIAACMLGAAALTLSFNPRQVNR